MALVRVDKESENSDLWKNWMRSDMVGASMTELMEWIGAS